MADTIRCPECGIALEGHDIIAHADHHYPPHTPYIAWGEQAWERRRELYQRAGRQLPPFHAR